MLFRSALDEALAPLERALVEELLEGVPPEQLETFRAVMGIINRNADRIRRRR